jgi:nicotinate-nucleotide pyrophosphorylase (carboxylating)
MRNFAPDMEPLSFIRAALAEDIGSGDHTSLSTIPSDKNGSAHLLVKEDGVLSGLEPGLIIFKEVDPALKVEVFKRDGDTLVKGDIVLIVEGAIQSILKAERLVLNCMQRLSGVATITRTYSEAIKGTGAKVLDTRKTTPLLRQWEKNAVKHGGGYNHRFGLFDMILIKDNHVDGAGGIRQALEGAKNYLLKNKLDLQIEIETRNLQEVQEVLSCGIANRIMFDNFSPSLVAEAVQLVNKQLVTEASGGINLTNIRAYAEAGVDFISVGALTHSVKSLDLSLKIRK